MRASFACRLIGGPVSVFVGKRVGSLSVQGVVDVGVPCHVRGLVAPATGNKVITQAVRQVVHFAASFVEGYVAKSNVGNDGCRNKGRNDGEGDEGELHAARDV